MGGVALVLAHLLVLYLVVLEPLLGARMYRSLLRNDNFAARLRFYRATLILEWSWVFVVALVLLLSATAISDIGLRWPESVGSTAGLLVAVLGGIAVSTVLVARAGSDSPVQRSLEDAAALLPRSTGERWMFAAVSVTAGICEEIVFRGFLIFYLSDGAWGLPIWAAVALSSVVFGLAHVYQGWRGVVGTGFFGIGMAALYLYSGSLLAPILVHALFDLRVLLMRSTKRP